MLDPDSEQFCTEHFTTQALQQLQAGMYKDPAPPPTDVETLSMIQVQVLVPLIGRVEQI